MIFKRTFLFFLKGSVYYGMLVRLPTSAMRKIRFNGGPLRKGYTVGVEGTLDTRSSPTVLVVLLFLRNCMEGAALCFMQFSQRWTLSRCRHYRPLSFPPEPHTAPSSLRSHQKNKRIILFICKSRIKTRPKIMPNRTSLLVFPLQ